MRRSLPLLFALIVLLALSSACSLVTPATTQPAVTNTVPVRSTPTQQSSPDPYPGGQPTLLPTLQPYPQPQDTLAVPAATAETSPVAQASATGVTYPDPNSTSETPVAPTPYPDPYLNPAVTEPSPYPYPYPYPEPQETGLPTPTQALEPTRAPAETATRPTPTPVTTEVAALQTAAAERPTATLYVPPPSVGQVKMSGQVTIWHSLDAAQLAVLQDIVRSFVRLNPEVSFEFQYFPVEILRQQFYAAAYRGSGPSLLIAPAEWGAAYYADFLVEDLRPYIVPQFLDTILPAPLASCQVKDAQVALPVMQTGLVLFRNTSLVASPSADLSSLRIEAEQATRAGRVGLFVDLGAEVAAGFLPSQGGLWTDSDGHPVFDHDNYEAAKKWLSLLKHLASFSGVEYNQDQSLMYFEQGRVGMTFADVSQRHALAEVLGTDSLAVDPWPEPMGTWIKSTAVYLNANVSLRSSAEHYSALMFMGALLSQSVQNRLATAGAVPVVRDVTIMDTLDASAYAALADQQATYPLTWGGSLRPVYLSAIDRLIQQVLVQDLPPDQALPEAWQTINDYLK